MAGDVVLCDDAALKNFFSQSTIVGESGTMAVLGFCLLLCSDQDLFSCCFNTMVNKVIKLKKWITGMVSKLHTSFSCSNSQSWQIFLR